MKFITIIFIVLNCLFVSYSFAAPKDSIYDLAITKRELLTYDEPAVSPNGEWVAYTVKERVDNPNDVEIFLPDGTPAFMAGCHIYLSNESGIQVGPIPPKNGFSWRPIWSPDGKQLAFYSNASGKCTLWIYDLLSGLSRELSDLQVNTSVHPMDSPFWNREGTEIYLPIMGSNQLSPKLSYCNKKSPSRDRSIVKTFCTKENHSNDCFDLEQANMNWLINPLVAIDTQTGFVRTIVSDQTIPPPTFMTLSTTGRWLAYLSLPKEGDHPAESCFDLIVSRTTGDQHVITVAENLIAHDENVYVWHPSKDILVYEKDKKLHLVELNDRGIKHRVTLLNDSFIEFGKEPLLFTKDGNFLIAGCRPFHDKPGSLFIVSLNGNRAPVEIHFQSPWKYLSTIRVSESEAWQKKGHEISVIVEKEDSGETAIVKLDITKSSKVSEGHFVWQGMAKLRAYAAKANPHIVYGVFENLTTPQTIYCAAPDFSNFRPLSTVEARLDQVEPPILKVFETSIPSYDGQLITVKTAVLLPKNYDPRNPPPGIVLFYPGDSMSNDLREFAGGHAVCISNFLFLNAGYALILPDIPLKPEGKVSHRIQEIVAGLLPQVYHAINLNYVNPNRIGIMGHSYGGYGTAAVLTRTNLFKAAVASDGLYDLGGFYGHFNDQQSFINMHWSENGQGGMGQPLWNNPQHYLENSPYYLANKIHTPLLLIHGEEDSVCPVIEARKMFAALKRLKRDAELAIYPGQGHVTFEWTKASALDASKRVITFFNKHLTKESS